MVVGKRDRKIPDTKDILVRLNKNGNKRKFIFGCQLQQYVDNFNSICRHFLNIIQNRLQTESEVTPQEINPYQLIIFQK